MRFSIEGKCPKVKPIETGCECEDIIVDVGTGLIKDGNLISIDIDKLKELLATPKDTEAVTQPPAPQGFTIQSIELD